MTNEGGGLCDEQRMQMLVEASGADAERGVAAVDDALVDWPEDPRLHFLRGSLLIGLSRFVEAHAALSRAVALAPGFHIARFQLGFFELTSGESEAARGTWAPLRAALPADHYLRCFAEGLEALIEDRFEACVPALTRGISLNSENLPLNGDMALIIGKCEEAMAARTGNADAPAAEEVSATSFLLGTRGH